MRITNNQFYVTVLQNIRRPTGQLLSLQEKLSSGKRINRYADDPAGAALAENYKGTRAKTVQFKRNIDDALGWMQQTEGVLNQLDRFSKTFSRSPTASTGASISLPVSTPWAGPM